MVFAGVALVLSLLPVAYLAGAWHADRKADQRTFDTRASGSFAVVNRSPEQLNRTQVGTTPSLATPAPLREMQAMQQRMDALFDRVVAAQGADLRQRMGTSVGFGDLKTEETRDRYLFTLAIPGLEQGSLDIRVESGRLTISGETRSESAQGSMRSSRSSAFSRSVSLPGPVAADSVNSTLKDGVLTVEVKKLATPNQTAIEIGEAAPTYVH